RWEHINQNYSLLTELQAFQLNVHFTVEQKGRYNAGYLLQFNGTAGVWRKQCITEAGGWEADTLTEDLDLSYRAQLCGWKIRYLEEIISPAELPADINGLKSQQYRWMKGGAETAKKLLPIIWKSDLTISKKIQATSHLLSSSIFVFIFAMSILSVPLIFVLKPLGILIENFAYFLVSLLSVILVYYVANVGVAWPRQNKAWMILKFLWMFPIFLGLSMGLAFHNGLAVIQGFLGKTSSFVRTPKYGSHSDGIEINKATYFSKKIGTISIIEGLLSIYFFMALYLGWVYGLHEFIGLHLLLAFGYLALFFYALQSKISK
ncbi:MAG: glycosyltransferase, partial [Saprospiraceae bacterium]